MDPYNRATRHSKQVGIIAKAGGGQSTATQLAKLTQTNVVATVATTADSVKLPATTAGDDLEITIINAGANSLNLFPATGEQINALGANNAFALAAGKVVRCYCTAAGQWYTLLTA